MPLRAVPEEPKPAKPRAKPRKPAAKAEPAMDDAEPGSDASGSDYSAGVPRKARTAATRKRKPTKQWSGEDMAPGSSDGPAAEGEQGTDEPARPKPPRKAPAESAKEHAGATMLGLDGRMWTSKASIKGIFTWRPPTKAKKEPKPEAAA